MSSFARIRDFPLLLVTGLKTDCAVYRAHPSLRSGPPIWLEPPNAVILSGVVSEVTEREKLEAMRKPR
jgi:hypothetical protein